MAHSGCFLMLNALVPLSRRALASNSAAQEPPPLAGAPASERGRGEAGRRPEEVGERRQAGTAGRLRRRWAVKDAARVCRRLRLESAGLSVRNCRVTGGWVMQRGARGRCRCKGRGVERRGARRRACGWCWVVDGRPRRRLGGGNGRGTWPTTSARISPSAMAVWTAAWKRSRSTRSATASATSAVAPGRWSCHSHSSWAARRSSNS